MKKSVLAYPFLASMALVSVPAWGQDQASNDDNEIVFSDTSLSEIIVTGLPASLGDRAYNATEISIDSLQTVENALRDVPGLQQFRRSDARSANPTSQGITLRGLGGNASSRALLILDGVPQADPFGGWVAWPGYDALPLIEARVRRGGGSGADGQGAVAGTIELFSDNVGDLIELGAAYGSRNNVDADLIFGRELGQGQLTISANYARGDGFIPIIEGQRGSVDRPAEYEQTGLSVRFVAPLSDNIELQSNVRAFTDDRERGFAFSENHNDGGDASIRLVDRNSDWQWSAL
ncbi:MAG: TonB-dependent receptor plug domain-containing protein, partial [Sphingomonadales bacterium]|nr:TonB-dependent receptor plug domain-containing protein [Sphingomonadales bacterium]